MITADAMLAARILVVDDQPANVQLLEMMLRRAGYLGVSSTIDPTEVCALHRKNHYDLILLDLQMPEMDGFQVMESLNKIETDRYLAVIVITVDPTEQLRALRAGAKDFITKPFDTSEVLIRIHNMLEVRLLHEEAKNHHLLLEETIRERTADLRRSEEMFRELAANIPDALCIRNTEQQTVQYVNPAWQKLSGLSVVPGDPIEWIVGAIHPDDAQWVTNERRKSSVAPEQTEYRLVRPDQSIRWVRTRSFPIANPSGTIPWEAEIIEDFTQHKEAQRKLTHLARHDALTDLPNRAVLYEALHDALARAGLHQQVVSVLLLDIDHFKNVNDSLGHAMGDALLREFAQMLSNCVRPGDIVARLGGDEFAVVVLTPDDAVGAVEVATRIQKITQRPLSLEGQTVLVTVSIGIASCPTDATDLKTLIRCADAAMYSAKDSGRNTFRRYTKEMNARATKKSDVEGALRLAQARGEFVLHYQPKMHIDSGKWTSVEALIRWKRPGHGLVPPSEFIPALEEMGLIVPVGSWVIDKACRQIREWQIYGLGRVPIAVNVSSKQLLEEDFVSRVAKSLHQHRVDPALLEIEITEGTLMEHSDSLDVALRRLKDMNVMISIDDFGTGYSNLAYLKGFLVDALKIDITFIRNVTTDADDATIAAAIINMAHSLRLRVVAEGVETPEQLEFLRVHGCDEAQGYFLSRPLPADQISERFREIISQDAARQLGAQNGYPSETHA